MKKDIEKVVLSTAIAKLCNENISDNKNDYSFNVKLEENDLDYFRELILDGHFDYLSPISLSAGTSLLMFKCSKDDFLRVRDLKEHFVTACNENNVNMFDLDYSTKSIMRDVVNKMNESDISSYRLDKVLETNVPYHIVQNPKNSSLKDVHVRSDKRDNLSFSVYNHDGVLDMLEFTEKTKKTFRDSLKIKNPDIENKNVIPGKKLKF
jgi:hypothetical protein